MSTNRDPDATSLGKACSSWWWYGKTAVPCRRPLLLQGTKAYSDLPSAELTGCRLCFATGSCAGALSYAGKLASMPCTWSPAASQLPRRSQTMGGTVCLTACLAFLKHLEASAHILELSAPYTTSIQGTRAPDWCERFGLPHVYWQSSRGGSTASGVPWKRIRQSIEREAPCRGVRPNGASASLLARSTLPEFGSASSSESIGTIPYHRRSRASYEPRRGEGFCYASGPSERLLSWREGS